MNGNAEEQRNALKGKVDAKKNATGGMNNFAPKHPTALNNHGVPSGLSKALTGGNKPSGPGLNNDDPDVSGNSGADSLSDSKQSNNSGGLASKLPGGGMANLLGNLGKSSSNGEANGLGNIKDKIKKIKMLKTVLPIILSMLGTVLPVIFIVIAILLPTILIGSKFDQIATGVSTFGDKFLNFSIGNGFNSSSDLIANRLRDAKNNFLYGDYPHEGEFDEGILLATIHNNNILDFDIYTDTNSNNSSNNYNSEKTNLDDFGITTKKSNSFYQTQYVLLGNPNFTQSSDSGLIFNLVDYHVAWECQPKKKLEEITNSFSLVADLVSLSLKKIDLGLGRNELLKLIREASSFNEEGFDFIQYLTDNYNFDKSDIVKTNALLDLFSGDTVKCIDQEDENGKTVEYIAYPYVSKYINYQNYFKYVADVYIPTIYFNCDNCLGNKYTEEQKKEFTKNTITEIINERNAYYDAIGKSNILTFRYTDDGRFITSTSYGTYISNIPVGTAGTGWSQGLKNGVAPSWAGIELGNGPTTTMARVGCYLTSIAILMANSGTAMNVDYFDPGVLALHLKSKKAFSSGGSMLFHSWTEIVPNFKWQNSISIGSNNYSEVNDIILSKLSEGYYVQIAIKGHFLAVAGAENKVVIISDPAGGRVFPITDFAKYYPSSDERHGRGVIQSINLYKG